MADADAIAAMLAGIKIYYINLDRATLRREAMEAQLARCDDVVRVAAVDGAADAAAPAARLRAWGLEDDDRSPAELACVLSHVEAAARARDGGGDLSLVLEDDACLAHVAVPLAAIAARAPEGWTVLQLWCNNADAQRASLAAGAPFAPWRRDHWGAGAYLLSRAGAAACADPSTFSPRLGKLVADEAVFWRAGAHSYTRPCVGDLALDGSAIQSADHTELVHGPSRALNRAYFSGAWHDRRVLGALFDGRAALAVVARFVAGDADPAAVDAWVADALQRGATWVALFGPKPDALAARVAWLGGQATWEAAAAPDPAAALAAGRRLRARHVVWLPSGAFLAGPPLAAALDGDDPAAARRAARHAERPLAGGGGGTAFRLDGGAGAGPPHAALRAVASRVAEEILPPPPKPPPDHLCWRAKSSGAVVRAGVDRSSAVVGEVARGGGVVLARDPFRRAADGTQRCAVAAPLVGFASLKSLEPWGRATTLYWELSALQEGCPAYWSDGSDGGSDDECGDAPARAYDPVERWAAGARAFGDLAARARYAVRGAEARAGPGRLSAPCALDEAAWAAGAPPGPWPCRGLALPPRGAVAGRVSVVCPTTADRRPFHALLLANARCQTWPDVELLVYDDGPAPSPLLRGARDCLYVHGGRDPRLPLGEKRNRLLALATGEYVANFDDDNVYAPTYLEAMVRRLDASGAGLVSLDEAWVATLAGAAANGADACRRLGGFHARGETFLHRNVALAAAAYAPLNVGEEVGLLTALPNTAVVDDVGLFLHVEHGRNTVDFELLDGREEDVAFTQLLGRASLPAAAPLRGSWPARELGELWRALAAADATPPPPPDAAATPERGA